ncbi:MAG TPA: hypothetical protein VLJ17_15190 [Xanthobacteraceae bacterium]|nr:hypothetical protein [Xanthobacteraceae bacterium]
MARDCEICGGARVIRLPVRRKLEVQGFSADDASAPIRALTGDHLRMDYREYPCPECGTKANVERVFALDVHSTIDSRVPSEAMPHIRASVAHRLVEGLLQGGYIEFEEGRPDLRTLHLSRPIFATLYAVHPGEARQTIESRIRERQDQVAKVAAEAAISQIENWGSASRYADGLIEKRHAAKFIREAVVATSNQWSKASQLQDAS